MTQRTLEADLSALELKIAKEILQEVFGATPSEVDEMIRARLDERRGM